MKAKTVTVEMVKEGDTFTAAKKPGKMRVSIVSGPGTYGEGGTGAPGTVEIAILEDERFILPQYDHRFKRFEWAADFCGEVAGNIPRDLAHQIRRQVEGCNLLTA